MNSSRTPGKSMKKGLIRKRALRLCIMAYFCREISDKLHEHLRSSSNRLQRAKEQCDHNFLLFTEGPFERTSMAALIREIYLSNRTHEEARRKFQYDLLRFCRKYDHPIFVKEEDWSSARSYSSPTFITFIFHFGCMFLTMTEKEYFEKSQCIRDVLKRYSDQTKMAN